MQPLREGGSLPAIVDTEDGMFVLKFRGAGQGPKALVAEIITGELARELGLPVPEIALVEVSETFGRSEPDPEIQELLRASHGINVGMRYLDGAFNFDGYAASEFIRQDLAGDVVWLDAFTTNPDRTHRNPNLLICHRRPWLIDHGASLYAHHDWSTVDSKRTRTPFPLIKDHVLLLQAGDINVVDARLAGLVTKDLVERVVARVPDDLLNNDRQRYIDYLLERVEAPREFVAEIARAQEYRIKEPVKRKSARR